MAQGVRSDIAIGGGVRERTDADGVQDDQKHAIDPIGRHCLEK
jgi:hypothetical protein